uniref:Thioredoxin domain-containing protein n=1 Tax=Clytia hemisphaerica TaxID=252671 RepID=A0A7M5XDK5_9CNID
AFNKRFFGKARQSESVKTLVFSCQLSSNKVQPLAIIVLIISLKIKVNMKLFAALVVLCLAGDVYSKINLKSIISVNNIKEYKKILKRNKNVLTLYAKEDKSALNYLRWMEDVAKDIKGKGTIVYINCGESKDAKKLCKKYSVTPKPKLLKHYKDGEFNKDYDRKDTAKSLLNFMLDPTGDAPWEEDPAAKNVVQVSSEKELVKLRRKEKGPMLIMFYAPWCGYCKRLKPDYAAAATELKGKAVLVGMDVDKPDAFNVRYQFNITGFPTLIYFENGEQKYNYAGKMDKEGLISWMQDPKPAEDKKEEEEESWSEQAPEILHLTDSTFDEGLKEHASIVVMFYAPWCGHCKSMKPEFVDAAKQMTEEETAGKLAAVDCTKETKVCKKFDISGYPTVKYFENAEYKFKLNIRKKDEIVKFMKNPEEPPQPPPEDLPWSEVSGPEILHLTDANFKDELKKKKHVLVMFYAPWCGHCKKAKPEIEKAAATFTEDRKVWFAGVDCTVDKKSCEQFGVSGYPTFRYFLYGKKDFKYEGGRNTDAFIEFMKNPKEESAEPEMREPEWKDTPSGVVHLGENDFDDFIKSHPSMLVMFYAPWCGHCKQMKPAYTEAANELLGTDHAIAAVDCTKNRKLASKYSISGYPTLKYFKDGQPSDYDAGRDKDSIVSYLIQKTSGEPPKKKLTGWAAENNFVNHLDSDNFDSHMQDNPSVLVMFYAPWCGHCKKMKPDYADASHVINHEKRIPGSMAAVDCTANADICNRFEIRGYPT